MDNYITIKELEKILNSIPKTKIEKDNNSWGDVTPYYDDMITPESVMYYVKEFIKSEKYQRKRKIEKLNE